MVRKKWIGIMTISFGIALSGCRNIPLLSSISSGESSNGSNSEESSSSTSSASSSSSSSTSLPPDEDGVVTLYSINDFHGKIQQDNQYNGILALQGAILSSENYEESSLILSAGDMWQGSYLSGYDKGYSTTLLMNDFAFDAMTLGNHEFDWGVDVIQENMEAATFPILCANLVKEGTKERPEWIQDHVVFEVEGHKIGIVGAIGADLESDIKTSALEGYEFTNSISILQDSYDSCIEEGAEVVLLSLHDDKDSSYTNNIQSRNIGFLGIFGGHSHQFQNESGNVPYVQGGSDSRGYSYMRIDLNEKKIDEIRYVYVDSDMEENATMDFRELVEALIESRPVETIGYIQGSWNKEKTANLVVRAMFYAAQRQYPEKDYDESNLIAVHNTGGIRASFPYASSSTAITMVDIQLVSPFDNTIYLLPDKTIRSSGLENYNYCYPLSSTLNGKKADIVIIDFLLDKYNEPMYDSTGGEEILDDDGDPYIIYDAVADYIRDHSSIDNPLQASDFQ